MAQVELLVFENKDIEGKVILEFWLAVVLYGCSNIHSGQKKLFKMLSIPTLFSKSS